MANESIPLYSPGETVTVYAGAAITGKRFAKVSADRQTSGTATGDLITVAPATAGSSALGVVAYDVAQSAVGVVHRGGIVPVTAGGTVAAGDRIGSDSTGKAVTYASGVDLGYAVSSATSGNDVFVALNLG